MFKSFFKEKVNRIGIVKKYYMIIDELDALKEHNRILYNKNIDLRIKLKKLKKEKINVVFVCHRPAVWGALKSVYEELEKDNNFNVYIVAIPNKKEIPGEWLYHEIYESEGAEEFWKEYGCINGYNYETKEWFDLKTLNPDYVFFQQPYNITRCPDYKSSVVSTYAKICYVAYFDFMDNMEHYDVADSCYPIDFLQDCSYVFAQNSAELNYLYNRFSVYNLSVPCVEMTGYPKYDGLEQYQNIDSQIWSYRERENHFRVIWTPRWSTREGNCHFFKYKDLLVEFCKNNLDIDFVFRPHPQSWSEWETTGELTEAEREKFFALYGSSDNMNIDGNTDYLPMFYHADCLISDTSSIIPEFLVTGKPVIYCYNKDSIHNFASGKGMSNGMYWVSSWEELEKILKNLRNGIDPLKFERQKIISKMIHKDKYAGKNIHNILVR